MKSKNLYTAVFPLHRAQNGRRTNSKLDRCIAEHQGLVLCAFSRVGKCLAFNIK